MKPRIAIPTPNSRADYSARALPQYMEAIEAAGGEAVEISIAAEPSEIAQLIKTCDAILLPGSPADVDPQKYGAARDARTSEADPARDDADELLLQDAHNMRKPILAICYGVQSLNVWRSGTLVQHLETGVQHSRPKGMASGQSPEHAAAVEAASHLAKIVERALRKLPAEITINSSHHQSVEQPGDGLRVVARSAQDGVIEAVESTAPDHFVLGLQWHPERMWQTDATSREVFRTLVEEAKKWHEQRAAQSRDFETLERD
jgi:putative glutamine amidotransferase